ncbi:MAG: hypothetical protein M3R35_00630 [Candidatus Eremiobacteraeota bacterium]|nr:hypothetical protein [Candidatus Eremiobacteraeota bacterium]
MIVVFVGSILLGLYDVFAAWRGHGGTPLFAWLWAIVMFVIAFLSGRVVFRGRV